MPAHPEIRKNYREFFAAIKGKQDLLPGVLRTTLMQDDPLPNPNFALWEKRINYAYLIEASPADVDPLNYLRELLKLNSPNLWNGLIDPIERQNPKILTDIRTSTTASRAKPLDVIDTNAKLTESLVMDNEDLYIAGVVMIGMAALVGPEFKKALGEETVWLYPYAAARSAASTYTSPAQSFDELMGRLRQLYPGEESQTGGRTAMDYLRENGAFGHVCPAVNFTSGIFRTYGNLLKSQEYQEYLRNQVRPRAVAKAG